VTFARTKISGNGRLDFRLEIAGWPHEWTTSGKITHATNRDSREVFSGLQYTGLKISEKAVLKDCWTQQGQLTVKIKPTTLREETIDSFTRTAVPVAYLAALDDDTPGIDFDSTSWTLDSGVDLPVGFYHLASECVHVDSGANILRARWSTTAQRHYISYGSTSAINVPIYSYPPTMEGRRVVLYAYGAGDDGAGNGTSIWRGIVARPPALDNDGITWTIQLDPIIKSLDQNVAASESLEYHVRGIYHSNNCPVRIKYGRAASPYDTTVTEVGETVDVTGFFENDDDLATAINAQLATLIANRTSVLAPTHTSEIATATYNTSYFSTSPTLIFVTNTDVGGHPPAGSALFFSFWFEIQSYLEGYCSPRTSSKTNIGPSFQVGGPTFFPDYHSGQSMQVQEYFGDGNKEFATPIGKDQTATPIFTYPLSRARAMLGSIPFTGLPPIASNTLTPADRIYLDLVDGILTGDFLLVKNGDKVIPLHVTDVNVDDKWITAEIQSGDSVVWFDSTTLLLPIRTVALDAGLPEFLQGLQDEAVNANDGDSPYTPPGDINVARFTDAYSIATIDSYWKHRNYAFLKPTPIKKVVQEELKAIGWMTRIEATGDVGCTPLPIIATNQAATSITDADILLPAKGLTGDWIKWSAQTDGLVNNVTVRLGYNTSTDDYDSQFDFSVRNIASIAEHKTNGTKASAEIAPVSTPAQQDSPLWGAQTGIGPGPSPVTTTTATTAPNPSKIATWVENYLRVLSMDYATVTIQVPWKYFDLLVGDLVNVTCSMIPNGTGKRGIVSKKAAIIGREWNLDPATNGMGTLTLYFPREVSSGYAPSGHVTSQTNTTGNTWDLHFNGSDDLNVRMSEALDGDVTRHFGIGDKVQVFQRDAGTIPINVKGVVTLVSSGTVRVTFESTWTPGSDEWILEYQRDDGTLPDHQEGFSYVANTQKLMHDGSVARRYL
jgi:hypothetical protein